MSRNKRDPKLPHGSDKCQCTACGEYFSSTYAFDRHRYGPFNGDRRCLSGDEMVAKGWSKGPLRHWARRAMPHTVVVAKKALDEG